MRLVVEYRFGRTMKDEHSKTRLPIAAIVLLLMLPIPFIGPDSMQQIYGRIPAWLQVGIVFAAAPYILISSLRLAICSARKKQKGVTALCAICAVLGAVATTLVTGVVAALGAGPWALLYTAIGCGVAAVITFAKDIWRLSIKVVERYA
jgi:hypothetical protein